MSLSPDHPVFAVVAPPRLARFRELLGVDDGAAIDADFTGWSKLVLLVGDHAVLFPRDHTQVEPLEREVAILESLAPLDLAVVPKVRAVWNDPALSAYPVVSVDRMHGVPLSSIIEEMTPGQLGDIFSELGRLAAVWHNVDPRSVPTIPRRDTLGSVTTLASELELEPADAAAAELALDRARTLDPVLAHADLHEGQILVDPAAPHRITGLLDWQTARIDHPFVEFDLGEWGTALWRGHRVGFPELRRRAWQTYSECRSLPDDLGPVFEWHHACSHARRRLGLGTFPVAHDEGVVGTLADARRNVIDALRNVRATIGSC